MKSNVLLEHHQKVNKAIFYALLLCFTVFFFINLFLGAGLLTSSAFLLGILIIVVANIVKLKDNRLFKSYIYITVTTGMLVFFVFYGQ